MPSDLSHQLSDWGVRGPMQSGSAPSLRLLVRQSSGLLLERSQRWRRLLPLELVAGVVFEVTLAEAAAPLPFHDPNGGWIGIRQAAFSSRSVSASAVALSMRLPPTTVRRKMGELVAAGVLTRADKGVRIAPTFARDPAVVTVCDEDARSLDAALETLQRAGYARATEARRAVAILPTEVTERLLLKFEMRVMETQVDLHGNVTDSLIVGATIAANINHIDADPVLARRFADEGTLPPDTLRRPITIRALSRRLGMPFETVRRRIADLAQRNTIVMTPQGVIVPGERLMRASHAEHNRRLAAHFESLLAALTMLAQPR